MPSKEYARIYEEIRQLMKAKRYAEAYVAAGDLRRFAVTRGQLVKVLAIEIFCEEKAFLSPEVRQ